MQQGNPLAGTSGGTRRNDETQGMTEGDEWYYPADYEGPLDHRYDPYL